MYNAKIIEDSVHEITRKRLTTFEVTYPRFVHAELMTHRAFSRNAASSRAIPQPKLKTRIMTDPAFPVWWGKNQSGMQAHTEIEDTNEARNLWLDARNAMLRFSDQLVELGMHKQIANRLLEPWMFITVIITATEYQNFFFQRTSKAIEGDVVKLGFDPAFPAQPEIQKIARLMWLEYNAQTPIERKLGEWHLPYISEDERKSFDEETLVKISTARCARVSYLTHDGKRDTEEDVNLYNKLLTGNHWSPFEHPAQARSSGKVFSNFGGNWIQHRKNFSNENYRII